MEKNNLPNDLGLGTKGLTTRNMNRDGSYNIVSVGEPFFRPYEIFHTLLTTSWLRFFGLVVLMYVSANLIFASLYVYTGVENLAGEPAGLTLKQKYFEAFFFSSQTITTLGYGRIAPIGMWANIIAALESMIGLMLFALATGLLYGRFSRPNAKLLYSSFAVLAPYQKGRAMMFRLTNLRKNSLIELEIDVTLGYLDLHTKKRSFANLELERKKINLFPLSWTIVHPITEKSPFWKRTAPELEQMKIEIIVYSKVLMTLFPRPFILEPLTPSKN